MDGQIRTLICDDNPVILDELTEIVRESADALAITAVTDLHQLTMEQRSFQIAVIDLKLAKASGIDAAREILSINPGCHIIFVSGYLDYVTDVYDVPHLCLILKNRAPELLPKYINRALELLRQEQVTTLPVRFRGKTVLVEQKDICYVELHGHISCIHCLHQMDYEVPDKLDVLFRALDNNYFCRCHVSYLVNLRNVMSYQRTQFTMRDGAIVPISRVHIETVRAQYTTFLKSWLATPAAMLSQTQKK